MNRAVLLLLAGTLWTPQTAFTQSAVDPSHGIIAVAQALRGLGSVKRVLVIGAHPDDEDTGLLTAMVRGYGADAAYLSLNRGEGGQNLIGPELGVGLGIIRTEELLAARRLDGARQFFTRAYDFGYSKSVGETFRFWPRDSLLADVVYVIRRFRPQVVVSIFAGTRRDGHGQHQAAGLLAREAFDLSGDPSRFPEQLVGGLHAWTPLKLYRSTRFDTASTTLTIETGTLDPLLGRSYHQIAMASRSRHRSQDMGRIESLGPRRTSVQLLKSRAEVLESDGETSLFDGVDTTLAGLLPSIARRPLRRALEERLADYRMQLELAREAVGRGVQKNLSSQLGVALSTLRTAMRLAADAGIEAGDLWFALEQDETKLRRALTEAAGVIIDAFSDDDLVVPGQSFDVEVQIWDGGAGRVELRDVSLLTPAGWEIDAVATTASDLAPGSLARRRFRLTVPEDAEPTRPYFLRAPRCGAVYSWPAESGERATPFGRPLVQARVEVAVAGNVVQRSVEVVYRFADQARGEVRRPLYVVPAVGLSLTPSVSVWPIGQLGDLAFSVNLRNEAPAGSNGMVRLEVPPGWRVAPKEATFELSSPGRATAVDFRVKPPAGIEPGSYEVRALAETPDGHRFRVGYSIIDYPHIRRRTLVEDATARVRAFELRVERATRVAYVPGAGDAVADAIKGMGVPVEELDERSVAVGDLSRYGVIVIGIRAYETNPALVAGNDRFLEWVRKGGTLIVQYQQYGYFRGNYAPYVLRARRPHDRVSDELAPVKILQPDHPVFNRPNRIGLSDFDGWVQERGLYFPYEWDESYQPLLEMSDPGEQPERGALLVARYGDGLYVYTGLSLFRQLPSAVPGAHRLLANLLALRG